MNLQIERPYLEAMISEFPRLAPLRDQLRFGNKVTLPLYQFNGAELGFLSNLYREAGPALRTRAAQLATLQQAFDGQGTGFYAEDPTATHRDTDWSRKDAVMLIDEADVYIKRRDDNIAMNAVVGVFLRVLEYFNGLLFLTTNRVDDIDEAIVSRCIALIRYDPPDSESRRRIWQVMLEQFALQVDDALLDELVALFPGASGRDIKGLAKLTAKYCSQKQVRPGIDVFRRCSVFRGMALERPDKQLCSA